MKPKNGYLYSSTELSRYYGLSIKGMEFYEQKKLIHPQRVGQSKTRVFSLTDCYRMASARMLRNCGMSLDETAELLENCSCEHVCECLAERDAQMQREILLLERRLAGMRRIEEMMKRIRTGNTHPQLTTMPASRRLFVRRFHDAHVSTPEESEEFCLWNSLMPMTEASLRFPREELLSGQGRLHTEIGMIIFEADFERFLSDASDRVSICGRTKAVHALISCEETALDQRACLTEALSFIRDNGLLITGYGYSRLVFVVRHGNTQMRWDELWIPVEE